MTFSIERQIIKNPQGKIKFWKPTSTAREHYHIGIWIEGAAEELNNVSHVEYKLPASFKRPERSSSNRGNKFSITIWTWGIFMMDIYIHMRDGSVQKIQYYLDYKLPADDGNNYVAVEL
jgi:transcription initiation factor IIF auxiliary subunit